MDLYRPCRDIKEIAMVSVRACLSPGLPCALFNRLVEIEIKELNYC